MSSSGIPSSSFSESDDKHTTSVSGFLRKTWPLEIRKQQQNKLETDRTKFQKKKLKYELASKGGTFPFWSPYISKVRVETLNSVKSLERSCKMLSRFRKTLFFGNAGRKRKGPKPDPVQTLPRIKWSSTCPDVDLFAITTIKPAQSRVGWVGRARYRLSKGTNTPSLILVSLGKMHADTFLQGIKQCCFHLRNKVFVFQYDCSPQIHSSTAKNSFPHGLTAGLLPPVVCTAFSC